MMRSLYAITRCTVYGTCQVPFFHISFGRDWSCEICDTSLIVFKERSHSPELSSMLLAGCILRSGELETIQLNRWVSVGLCVSLWLQSAV